MDFIEGEIILIDKPLKWTSFDVVAKIRNTFKIKKIGHAGTLDPLASGLLILCTGKKTKSISTIQDARKTYTFELELGKTTPSFDLETPTEFIADPSQITQSDIEKIIPEFIGDIEQTPPQYSAIKVNGKRAYKKARAGKEVEIKSRVITIYSLNILSFNSPFVTFSMECSKGTYVRTLVNDIGKRLGVGAYTSQLRRTQIGEFNVSNAHTIESFIKIKDANI